MVPAAVPSRDAILNAYSQSLIQFKARQLSRRRGFSRSDLDDLAQDLTLHLLKKAHLYDPARASINTFADRVITSAVRMILRDRRRQKRAAGFTALSLDHEGKEIAGTFVTVGMLLTQDDADRRTYAMPSLGDSECNAVNEVIQSLPSDLADIANRLKTGSVVSTARDLGVSRRQVYMAMEQIRERFEAAEIGW